MVEDTFLGQVVGVGPAGMEDGDGDAAAVRG
jgi:hypothetical protein